MPRIIKLAIDSKLLKILLEIKHKGSENCLYLLDELNDELMRLSVKKQLQIQEQSHLQIAQYLYLLLSTVGTQKLAPQYLISLRQAHFFVEETLIKYRQQHDNKRTLYELPLPEVEKILALANVDDEFRELVAKYLHEFKTAEPSAQQCTIMAIFEASSHNAEQLATMIKLTELCWFLDTNPELWLRLASMEPNYTHALLLATEHLHLSPTVNDCIILGMKNYLQNKGDSLLATIAGRQRVEKLIDYIDDSLWWGKFLQQHPHHIETLLAMKDEAINIDQHGETLTSVDNDSIFTTNIMQSLKFYSSHPEQSPMIKTSWLNNLPVEMSTLQKVIDCALAYYHAQMHYNAAVLLKKCLSLNASCLTAAAMEIYRKVTTMPNSIAGIIDPNKSDAYFTQRIAQASSASELHEIDMKLHYFHDNFLRSDDDGFHFLDIRNTFPSATDQLITSAMTLFGSGINSHFRTSVFVTKLCLLQTSPHDQDVYLARLFHRDTLAQYCEQLNERLLAKLSKDNDCSNATTSQQAPTEQTSSYLNRLAAYMPGFS